MSSALAADHPFHTFGDAPYLLAATGKPSPTTPVWFQRQAGRHLPEYHEVRRPGSILDTIQVPDLAAEITLQPVRRYGVDAAVLYSDIVTPLAAIGVGVDIEPGVGPVTDPPIRSAADLARLRPMEPGDVQHVTETVRILARELPVPLLGFAGAPFTLASYLIEGRPSRTHGRTKAMMLGEPKLWHELCERIADIAVEFLRLQVVNGASALQLFDSWAGALDPATYATHVAPHTRAIFERVADLGVPRAHFGVGTGELLGLIADTGPDIVGIDWRVPLDLARDRVGDTAVQGNLDPAVCLAPIPVVEAATRDVLARNDGRPGHIFNLGHGVLPETDPAALRRVVEIVHGDRS
ncbi:MAG: uroporphyrinogen decarboxylase [Actinomycetota bacterium]